MSFNNTKKVTFVFKMKFDTNKGENICIFGEHPLFGNWENPVFFLNWSKNNIWSGEITLPLNTPLIKYKFAVISENNKEKRWEDGPNRLLSTTDTNGLPITNDNKYLLICIWNHFIINFNIYFPLKNPNDYLQIVGDPKPLSNWMLNNQPPIKMELSEEKTIKAKDGNEIKGQFWVVSVIMRITNPKSSYFEYRYSAYSKKTKTAIWEREPNRRLKILFDLDSEENQNLFKNNPDENKLLTNSFLQKLDVNFVADLDFNQMGDKKIFIGPYPQSNEDFKLMAAMGINATLNVQTDKDLYHRQVDINLQMRQSEKLGIKITRYPIEDFDQNDLIDKLKGAGDKLKELLDEGKTVYVHCTAGMSRAAATVIIYLVLYEDFSVEEARDFVKKYRPIICPNYNVINRVVSMYKPDKVMNL